MISTLTSCPKYAHVHRSIVQSNNSEKEKNTLTPSIYIDKPLLIRIIDVTIQNKTLLTRQSIKKFHKNCHKLIQKPNQNQSKTWNKVYKWYYIRWYTSIQRIHTINLEYSTPKTDL